jgi:hypothetical protein
MSRFVLTFAGVEGADIGQQHRQRMGVVADARGIQLRPLAAHLHVGAFREHRVQVGGDHHQRRAGRSGAAAQAHDVALGVHLDVAQAGRLQLGQVGLGAHLLLERRGGDLGQLDGLGDDAVVLRLEAEEGGPEAGAGPDRAQRPVGRRGPRPGALRAGVRGEGQDDGGGQDKPRYA